MVQPFRNPPIENPMQKPQPPSFNSLNAMQQLLSVSPKPPKPPQVNLKPIKTNVTPPSGHTPRVLQGQPASYHTPISQKSPINIKSPTTPSPLNQDTSDSKVLAKSTT